MRFTLILSLSLVLLTAVMAWDKDDFEIFDLVSALEKAEGKGTTFYSHLGIDPSASTSDLNKAYRKKSLELHPDKNPGVKDIQERFARLGVITQILRSPERRERYNFFYKNGVPTWKGFGYAYTRWRPSLLLVLTFLAFLTSLFQYIVMRMNYAKDKRRVEYFAKSAKKLRGPSSGVRRKVRVPMIEGSTSGEVLELVVTGDDVFLPHEDGSLTSLSELAVKPSFIRTWPFTLISLTISRVPILQSLSESLTTTFGLSSTTSNTNGSKPKSGVSDDEDDDDEEEMDDTPTPAPRKGRAAELRARRLNGGSPLASGSGGGGSGTDSAATTDGEEGESSGGGKDGEKKRKSGGGGKAAAMRRRKMGLKK